MSRYLFYFSCLSLAFAYGVFVSAYKIFPYRILKHVKDSVDIVLAERKTLAGVKPEHFLQPSKRDGQGVTVNDVGDDAFVLLSGFSRIPMNCA